MKKITLLLFLFMNIAVFAQEYQIQLRLVDAEIGYPTGDPVENNPISNDSGLNSIFNAYNATAYFPGSNPVPDWNDRTHFVICNGCDINSFEQALLDYDTVIEHAVQNEPGLIANALHVKLVDLNNGNNTGNTSEEGIVITNNEVLNTIFVDNTVLYFEQAFPSSQNPELLKVFLLGCDCLASDLEPVLENEIDIVENTERLGYVILNTEEPQRLNFQFYPNPVEKAIVINSSQKIKSFELFNLFGQSLGKVTSESKLNNLIPYLPKTMYLLTITTVSDQQQTLKFIKK